jgi:hypothetical protein
MILLIVLPVLNKEKNMYKRSKLLLPMFVLLGALALGGCGNKSTGDVTTPPEPQKPGTPTEDTRGGYDDRGGYHRALSTIFCDGCQEFLDTRLIMTGEVEKKYNYSFDLVQFGHIEGAYDAKAWDLWYQNGGDYHNSEYYSITGKGGNKKTYTVRINDKYKAPCFKGYAQSAKAAGLIKAAELSQR